MAIKPRTKADGSKVYDVRVGSGPMRTFDRKKDADEYESKQKTARRRERAGMEPEKGAITFKALAELWIANYAPSQWRKSMLGYSVARWKDVYVRSMQAEAIGAWLHELPYAPKTKTHILQSLRQVLNAGVEWGYLPRNPARPGSFKAPGERRLQPIEPLESWAEVELVASKMPKRWQPVVLFVCATGLRFPSELGRVLWADIDWSERLLSVRGTKTENATRTIPLTWKAIDVLNAQPRPFGGRHPKLRPVFGEIDRHNFGRAWKKALADAGLEHRNPYQMRHTCATLALQAGASLDDVAELLGHGDIAITRRYYRKWTKPMADRLRGVLDTIGGEDAELGSESNAQG